MIGRVKFIKTDPAVVRDEATKKELTSASSPARFLPASQKSRLSCRRLVLLACCAPIAAARTVARHFRVGVRVPLPLRSARHARWAAGVGAVLAGIALLAPAPAQAQTTVWSATLTVDRIFDVGNYYFGCGKHQKLGGNQAASCSAFPAVSSFFSPGYHCSNFPLSVPSSARVRV